MIDMLNNRVKMILYIVLVCFITACGTSSEKNKVTKEITVALDAGNIKEAEKLLKEVDNGEVCRYYGGVLIDKYLSIDSIDDAIFVFDKITGHCSMYEMQHNSLFASASYTRTYSRKIYNALIKSERYDEAWSYHALSYETENYPGNAPDYFAYMSDVIIHMCSSGRSVQAQMFIKQKRVWFLKNVDNHEWGKDYPDFRYDIMCGELDKVYNSVKE